MSWTFYARCEEPVDLELLAGQEPCEGCRIMGEEALDESYTYNVSRMYYRAFVGTTIEQEGIRGLNNKAARTVIPVIEHAIQYFERHREELIVLEPLNKWGDYAGALRLLRVLLNHAQRHPRAVFLVT